MKKEINLFNKRFARSKVFFDGKFALILIGTAIIAILAWSAYGFGIASGAKLRFEAASKSLSDAKERLVNASKLYPPLLSVEEIQQKLSEVEARHKILDGEFSPVLKALRESIDNPYDILSMLSDKVPHGVWITEVVLSSGSMIVKGKSAEPDALYFFSKNVVGGEKLPEASISYAMVHADEDGQFYSLELHVDYGSGIQAGKAENK